MSTTSSSLGTSTSGLLKLGIPTLKPNEDGRSNWKNYEAMFSTMLKSESLEPHITQKYALVSSDYHGVTYVLPHPPAKYEAWEEVVGEAASTRKDRRAHYTEQVMDYKADMEVYTFELSNYQKFGQAARQAKYDLEDHKVIALINATVDPSISATFQHGLHAYDLWAYLKSTFGTTSLLTKGALYRDLMSSGMAEGETPRARWETYLSTQRELHDSPFAIGDALLRLNFMLQFAGIELYGFVYNKYRSVEIQKDNLFEAFLQELTVTFQDNGGRATGSTPGMFGRPGTGKDGSGGARSSKDCHATIKCQQCGELGHYKQNCREWRRLNPTIHVKIVTEPKRKGDKSGGDTPAPPGGATPAGWADVEFGDVEDDEAVDGC